MNRRNLCYSLALAALSAGCGDDNPEVATGYVTYPDYYGYAYYYPADLAYSVPYYVDDWYDYPYLYSDTKQLDSSAERTVGSLIRGLATGEELCPGQVSVDDTQGEVLCGGDEDQMMRTGATLTFDDCALEDGRTLDGTVKVESRRSFSDDACDPDTVVSVAYSGTFTNLAVIQPTGERTLIPNMTSDGSYTRLFRDRPAAISLAQSGSLQTYDETGSTTASVDLAGSLGVVIGQPPDTWDYRVYGPIALEDTLSGEGVSLTAVDLIHEAACCHPISGSLRIAHTSTGEDDVLTFGPQCGAGTLNDDPVNLPACP